jgi:hypothetical protein
MTKRFWGRALAGVACAWACLCSIGARGQQELPPIKVDLPPQPAWNASNIPEKYPDGKWSVRGLRRHMQQNLNKELEVKGVLVDIYQCPPEQAKCPKGKVCKPCDQPHYYVGDSKDTKKERALVVCNYPVKPKPPVLPAVGTEVVVGGTFTREAGGFAASDGLMDHKKTVTAADSKVVVEGNALSAAEEDLVKRVEAGEKGEKPPKRKGK